MEPSESPATSTLPFGDQHAHHATVPISRRTSSAPLAASRTVTVLSWASRASRLPSGCQFACRQLPAWYLRSCRPVAASQTQAEREPTEANRPPSGDQLTNSAIPSSCFVSHTDRPSGVMTSMPDLCPSAKSAPSGDQATDQTLPSPTARRVRISRWRPAIGSCPACVSSAIGDPQAPQFDSRVVNSSDQLGQDARKIRIGHARM
jgi:hypothetical protein